MGYVALVAAFILIAVASTEDWANPSAAASNIPSCSPPSVRIT